MTTYAERARRGLSFRSIGGVYVLLAMIVLFSIWVPETFPKWDTVRQILNNNSVSAMAALTLVVPLAAGVFDRTPGLPGVKDAIRRGLVRVCPICDGYEVIGKTVGVIGADAHAAGEAVFLTTWSDDVWLIHTGRPGDLPAAERRRLKTAGVGLIETPVSRVVLDRRRISALCFGPGEPKVFDALYAALGVIPRAALAVDAGARLDKTGRLVVGEHQETSVPGLYAAGDLVRGLNQLSVAQGEGAIAATDAHNALRAGR
jgi:thioredoxin reductase (NADPH)